MATVTIPVFPNDTNFTFSTTVATAIGLTKTELWIQLIFIYGILCTISYILHSLISIIVYKIERLRNRFFIFVFFISMARIVYALDHLVLAMHRILRTIEIVPISIDWGLCHLIHMLSFGSQTLELLLLFLLVIDQTVSLIYPMIYRNLGTKQAVKICFASCLFCAFFRFLPSYAGGSSSRIVQCINIDSVVHPIYGLYAKYLDASLSVAILIAYLILFGYIRFKLHMNAQWIQSEAAVKKSMAIMSFLHLQLLMHCCFVLSSRIIQLAAGTLGPATALAQRLQAIYSELNSIDLFVNAIIFYWKHPKLWYYTVRMIFGHSLAKKLAKKYAAEIQLERYSHAGPLVRNVQVVAL